ncbi:MAG: hypothetical protein IT454_00025 [Planctomycetes bacterium]|nr:hypothetical protein [Planctomycetota bacterium]
MAQDEPKPIGTGHMAAMGRQGLAELRAALYPESNVAQPPGYGIVGSPLPSEIAQEHERASTSAIEPQSAVESRLPAPEPEPPRQDEKPHEPERE